MQIVSCELYFKVFSGYVSVLFTIILNYLKRSQLMITMQWRLEAHTLFVLLTLVILKYFNYCISITLFL